MSAAVRVNIREKAFGPSRILGRVAFDVANGESVALTGPSGIGKTTLLRILCGLDTDFEGSVSKPDRMAIVFQEPVLLPWRSAIDNLTIVTGANENACHAMLARVGLAGKADHFPRQMSLGQQRRLALARAFVAKPDLLVMDEPFASLDEERADEMIALTKSLIDGSGVTTVFVTHSQKEAGALASRVLVLSGTPALLTDQ